MKLNLVRYKSQTKLVLIIYYITVNINGYATGIDKLKNKHVISK